MAIVFRRMTSTRRLQEAQRELDRIQSLPDPLEMEIERKDEIQSLQNDMMLTVGSSSSNIALKYVCLLSSRFGQCVRALLINADFTGASVVSSYI